MAFFLHSVVVFSMAVGFVTHADLTVDCGTKSVTLRWGGAKEAHIIPTLFRLCGLPPVSFSTTRGEAVFSTEPRECHFERQDTGNKLVYTYDVAYMSDPNSSPYPIICVYDRPHHWVPPTYNPMILEMYGYGDLVFHMGLMTEDFSRLALPTSNNYSLGSLIPILALVEQQAHQPLVLLLEECVASNAAELGPDSQIYPIITNHGCFVDSAKTKSQFLPRQRASEIRLYLQAFKFALGQEVYIHCKLVAWDPNQLDNSKKACHYDKENRSWELLDDPSQNVLCECCDSSCRSRRIRGVKSGLTQNAVLGPLNIVDSDALHRS